MPMIPESVFFKNQNDPRIRGLYAEMPILGGYTSTSCMNILHNQAMICIIKVSYWGAFPNSARLFCIYIIVALHIFPNFDFFSRPYINFCNGKMYGGCTALDTHSGSCLYRGQGRPAGPPSLTIYFRSVLHHISDFTQNLGQA